uniref:Uncharacterized protein n=1 Tax=Anser brachyrhynchus TaxID=132585 RepID=A0A8B9B8F2_9AVES
MSYWYQYKQQCIVPSGLKCATPVFTQCHSPAVVKSMPCTSCASMDANLCTARKMMQSSPKCPTPCTSSCFEKHIVQGHSSSSSCSTRSPELCSMVFPQPHVQSGQHLFVPQCRQLGITECPQIGNPIHVGQQSSYPCSSYQWSDSYHYRCGQS